MNVDKTTVAKMRLNKNKNQKELANKNNISVCFDVLYGW